MVNLQHPIVLESFLGKHGNQMRDDAFARGLSSALTFWHDWALETTYPQDIFEHTPVRQQADFHRRWKRNVRLSCVKGVADKDAGVRQHNVYGDLLRYNPIVSIGKSS